MPLDPIIAEAIQKLDEATTAVGARIQRFIDAAAAKGTMTAAEVLAALGPEVDRLTVLGQDPADPVPAEA